jgi:hypothetical protein
MDGARAALPEPRDVAEPQAKKPYASGPSLPQTPLPHPFFPLQVGQVWEYATTQESASQGHLPRQRSRDQVTRIERQGELIVATVQSKLGPPAATTFEHRATLSPAGLSPDPTPMITAAGVIRATASQGAYLPSVLQPGQRWSYSVVLDSPLQTSHVTATLAVVDEGELTVAAGRFHALHVTSTLHNRMIPKAPGSAQSPALPTAEYTQTEDTYWARGVGLIKARTRTDAGYAATRELVRFLPGKPAP